jgi:aspartate/methionine/tyrosine aminotransferase
MAGATARVITLQPPDWSFDREALRAAFNERTKLILVNTPHNPTGKVFSREELQFIADLCIEHDVMALMDEVYDRILFDGAEHVAMATLPGMWERTLTLNSTGKTFSMTGWKIGYAVGPASLNAALRAVHQFVTFASGTPFQDAMAEALETAEARGYYTTFAAEYDERRRAMADVLHAAGFRTLPISGSYFLMADIAGRGFDTDAAFCRWLTSEVKVAALPPSAFYVDASTAPMLARFCFAKKLETIAEAGRRMQAAGLRS